MKRHYSVRGIASVDKEDVEVVEIEKPKVKKKIISKTTKKKK